MGCTIQRFYRFLGKKWAYPFFINLDESRCYSFDALVKLTNRRISRSVLVGLLADGLELGLIEKNSRGYKITEFGTQIRRPLWEIRIKLLRHSCQDEMCAQLCLIDKKRV
ncbi:MAG: hypothetical protein ACLFP2_03230 [Candidatus Woesearchaeota archaeon]